jgi:hypothetical protein
MRGKHVENLSSYGGANLQLSFTTGLRERASQGLSHSRFTAGTVSYATGTVAANAGAVAHQIDVGYIISSILEVSNGVVDLQL